MSSAQDWQVGQTIEDEYLVEAILGRGGFGEVARVRVAKTGAIYAVKRAIVRDAGSRRRLLDELRLWTTLPASENIVDCYFVRSQGDELLIFSEYMKAGSLDRQVESRALYTAEASLLLVDLGIQLLRGLHWAHQHGLVHCDIKPSNLFFDQGVAKIGDFGLAGVAREPPEHEQLLDYLAQDIEDVAGRELMKAVLRKHILVEATANPVVPPTRHLTIQFASPEQLQRKQITPSTDLWSWAVVMLYAFNGELTWDSGDLAPDVLADIVANGPACPAAPALPAAVADVLRRCLELDPSRRFASAGAAVEVLQGVYLELARASGGPPCSQPSARPVMAAGLVVNTRQSSTGGRWGDPRRWLEIAFAASGRAPSDAIPMWPSRHGSRRAQIIADLQAMEAALSLLEDAYQKDARLQVDLAQLYAELALINQALRDPPGTDRRFGQALALVQDVDHLEALLLRAGIWHGHAIALREFGATEHSLAASDQAIAIARGGDEPERRRILAQALQTKANTLSPRSEQAMHLLHEAIEIYREVGDAVGEMGCQARQAVMLRMMGDEAAAAQLDAHLDRTFDDMIVRDKRLDLRVIRARCLYNRYSADYAHQAALTAAEQAAAIYDELLAEDQRDLVAEAGKVFLLRGKVQEVAALPHDACGSYQRAVTLLSEAVTKQGNVEVADDLATAMKYAATLLCSLGRIEEAAVMAEHAVTLWSSLERAESDHVYEPYLAEAYVARAVCSMNRAALAAAEADLQLALALFERMPPSASDGRQIRHAVALLEMGKLARKQRTPHEAIASYQRALAILDGVTGPEADHCRARAYECTSNALGELGQIEEAISTVERGIALWRKLVASPSERRRRADLGFALKARANDLLRLGLYEPALESYVEADAVFTQLVEQERRHDLLVEYTKLLVATGIALERLVRLDAASGMYRRVLAAAHGVERRRTDPEWSGFVAYVEERLASVTSLLRLTRVEIPRCCAELQQLFADAEQLRLAGEAPASLDFYERALTIITRIKLDQAPKYLALRANVLVHKGVAAMYAGHTTSSAVALRGAVADLDCAVAASSKYAADWARTRLGLATYLREHGNEDGVREALQPVIDRRPSWRERGWKKWRDEARAFLAEPASA